MRCSTVMSLSLVGALVTAAPALAKGKKAPSMNADQARSMESLGGKFKWGMSHEEVWKSLEEQVKARYKELIEKERDVNKQDDLRKNELMDIKKAKDSLVQFEGKKSGWDVSIIDKEFAHKNGESMIVMWEKDQRRFLFFWNGKLYKQYIAFDAEHPVFKGKTFDDFVKILTNRYGNPEMKFAQMRTKDDMVVSHMEWPAHGDYKLWAVDQSHFYGNFCLRLFNPKVQAEIDRVRGERDPRKPQGNALIDSVTKPDEVSGDKNADVVDQITGKKK